jgi:hypothetical protein
VLGLDSLAKLYVAVRIVPKNANSLRDQPNLHSLDVFAEQCPVYDIVMNDGTHRGWHMACIGCFACWRNEAEGLLRSKAVAQ